MRFSTALAFITLGASSSFGNAFANPNASKVISNNSNAFGPSITFISKSARGGSADTKTSLAATSTDASIDEKVAEHISPENWEILSARGQAALTNLINSDEIGAQTHVYSEWPEKGTDDDGKKKLTEQVSVEY